jgi:Protein of unknown function (DUF3499)
MTAPSWSRYGSRLRRLCARAGCNAPAVATLRFEPTERLAWLAELDESAARTQGDLCQRHAAALVLPRGWQLHDERVLAPRAAPVAEPPAPAAIGIVEADEEERAVAEVEAEVEAPAAVAPEPEPESNGNGTRSVPAQFGASDAIGVDEAVSDELETILDARTPLLQRAFRNARPNGSDN